MVSTIMIGVVVVAGYFAWKGYQRFIDARRSLIEQGKTAGIINVLVAAWDDFFVPIDRYPKDISDEPAKSLGGQPFFYNEVDHSRGRFLGWIRTDEDRADERKIDNGFYRARVTRDVRFFWFFVGHKEETTPCVFRPGIDAITKGPGEEEGVPPEGIVVFKRSMDGMKLAISNSERYRSLLLDEKHKTSIMADMIVAMKDKERLTGLGESSKEFSEEMENILRRSRKVHDAAAGRAGSDGMGVGTNPYGADMYGNEDSSPTTGSPGTDNLWKFEG